MQIHSPEILFFLKVCNYQSFSQAAERLNIPQPTVSRRIIALEHTLQRQLFIRSKSGLQLTTFGEEFKQHALRVRTELENLKNIASNSVHTSTIKLEAQPALGKHFVQSILPDFQREYPEINVDLSNIKHESLSNPSDAIRLHTYVPENLNRVNYPYLESNCGYYASKGLRTQFPEINSPFDLIKHHVPLINIKGDHYQREFTSKISTPTLFVDNALTAAEAVINNIGVSWNYQIVMQQHLENQRAVELFKNQDKQSVQAYISYPNNKQLSLEEESLISFIRKTPIKCNAQK